MSHFVNINNKTKTFNKKKKNIILPIRNLISGKLIRQINFYQEMVYRGQSIKGRQLGKKIGFPTANINIKDYIIVNQEFMLLGVKTKLIKLEKVLNLYRPTSNQKKT